MKDRIGEFYELHRGFRSGMRKLQADKAKKLEKLEPYKGSKGYEADVAKTEEEHRAAVRSMQDEYKARFEEVTGRMSDMLNKVTMEAPSEEELRLLSVLKMREHLTAEELMAASRSVKTAAALGVLEELRKKNNLMGCRLEKADTITVEEAKKAVMELSRSARTLCNLPAVDSRQEYLKSPRYDADAIQDKDRTALFSADVDYENSRDCLVGCSGGVSSYTAFERIVNA